jgi:hypothetical protein
LDSQILWRGKKKSLEPIKTLFEYLNTSVSEKLEDGDFFIICKKGVIKQLGRNVQQKCGYN